MNIAASELGPAPLTRAQERITGLVKIRVEALVRNSFADLGRWQTMLRSLANQLEDLETRAKRGQDDHGNDSLGETEPYDRDDKGGNQ